MTDRPRPTAAAAHRRTSSTREPWDPYVAERLTAEQEKYYMAGQWKLMWWRFRRHRPAVVSAIFLALMYFSTVISEFIAPYDLHTRHSAYIFAPPQQRPSVPRRQVPRAVRLCAEDDARPRDAAARLHARHDQAAAAALLLPRRFLRVLGPGRGQLPFRLPARGRHVLLAGHRSAGPRHVQPHRLCRAHLAHHRPHRHRALLHPGA